MQTPEKSGKGKTAAQVEQEFSGKAANAVKELKKSSGLSFGQISKVLEERELGTETPGQLKAKFRRGKFSYVFFLRMLMAMNVVEVKLLKVRWPEPGFAPKGFNLKMQLDRLPADSTVDEGDSS